MVVNRFASWVNWHSFTSDCKLGALTLNDRRGRSSNGRKKALGLIADRRPQFANTSYLGAATLI